jgi:hypothetical protein
VASANASGRLEKPQDSSHDARMASRDTDTPGTKEPARQHGGRREGSGRRPVLARKRLGTSAYVSLSESEKAQLEAKAAKRGLTLSFYLRERLGLSIE